MNITYTQVKALRPCEDGLNWYLENIEDGADLRDTLLRINEHKPPWSRWLFVRLLNRDNRTRIAIFSARLVLRIFESKHPDDLRPRKAIEAAENFLAGKATIEEVRAAAYAAAAAAAAAAAYAAYAAAAYAAAAAAAAAAAYAADAAAAYAADAAAYAADAAAAAARKQTQEKIIIEAVRLIEGQKQ